MTLVQAWVDSVSLLKPKHLKLFVLVTLKSIVEAYKVLAKYWWWLFVIIAGCWAYAAFAGNIFNYHYAERISQWAYQVLLFAALVATRPSLFPKDCAYFRSNMPYFLIQAVFLLFVSYIYWPSAFSAGYFFSVLFFLDSGKNIFFYDNKVRMTNNDLLMSWWRALLMVVYNVPLLCIVGLAFYTPVYLLHSKACFSSVLTLLLPIMSFPVIPLFFTLISAFLLPITVCTYTNIYIKKLHDQFDLYFKQPK